MIRIEWRQELIGDPIANVVRSSSQKTLGDV